MQELLRRGLTLTGPKELPKVTFADLRIRDKNERIVPFVPNAVQRRYLDEICPGWRDGDYAMTGTREVILKARQFGFSTLILALFFLDCINRPHVGSVVMAHDTVSTENLFKMVHRFYEYLPDDKKPPEKAMGITKRELTFPNGSEFRVMTAGTKTSGRGGTLTNLHCSEVAFWENADEVFGSVLESVPAGGNTIVETTANGVGGQGEVYYRFYQASKAGKKSYRARFYAWFDHDEYRIPLTAPLTEITEEEANWIAAFGVDHEQIAWMRAKVAEMPNEALRPQEYPCDDVEAFRVSGSKFFREFRDATVPESHIVAPFDIPAHWTMWGGYDWGHMSAAAFELFTADENGNVIVVDEWYSPQKTDDEQADAVVRLIEKWGRDPRKVWIYADPSMWHAKNESDGIARARVESFDRKLTMVKANNNRPDGWSNARRYFKDIGIDSLHSADDARVYTPALRLFAGNTPRLAEQIGAAVLGSVKIGPGGVKIEDTLRIKDGKEIEDHALDAFRYGLHSRPRASKPAPAEPEYNDRMLRYLGRPLGGTPKWGV